MGSGKSCSTTGYRYFAGLHLIFCHAVDRLLKIRVGEKTAWTGSVTANQTVTINKPNLFGGESREGGIKGKVDVCFGLPTQGRNGYLQKKLGSSIPAFRGLFGLVANKCMLSANNPYIKSWSVLAQRVKMGWRDDLAGITASDGFVDMNPAHMILEAVTNTTWGGMGYPLADVDLQSFQNAANLLGAEQMGLSLIWAKNTSIEDFIGIVCNHIDARVFFSHVTGLLTIKLVRNDYSAGALPVLDASNIIELVEYKGPSATEAVNQVTVNWVDRANQPQSVTVQDLAGLARTDGVVNETTLDFVGIAVSDLATRVAARELQQLCMPIASCTLVINRTESLLEPGDCFNFTWSPLGVENMVMRVDSIDIGAHDDSKIRIVAVRDVYGLGAVSLTTPATSLWADPINLPAAAVDRQVAELTWWQFVREYGESAAVLAELDDTSTMVQCYAGKPTDDAIQYEMWTRNTGGEWEKQDVDAFPWVGTLSADVVAEVSTVLTMDESIDDDLVVIGAYAAIGTEMVAITAIDMEAGTITVDRGVLDTVPVPHAVGAKMWCHQGLFGLDRTDRAVGESVEVKMLTATSIGVLEFDDAPVDVLVTTGRMMRPYPPGNVQINGSRWPVSIGASDELAVSWAHRDRTVQTVTLGRQDEGNIGPESGVSYTLRIYGETDTLLRTVTGITGTAYTYLAADEEADSGFVPARLNTSLRVELESVRGSLVSWQQWNLTVIRQ